MAMKCWYYASLYSKGGPGKEIETSCFQYKFLKYIESEVTGFKVRLIQ
jgi:hypothetical protein